MANLPSPHDSLPPEVLAALDEAELRLRGTAIYRLAWRVAFTACEREQLGGDVVKCREQNPNLIALYMKVRGVAQYRATIELADKLKLLAIDRDYLLHEVGQEVSEPHSPPAVSAKQIPIWDKASLTLKIEGELIREVKKPRSAKNIVPILDAFQEENWPRRIDDPLPGGSNPIRLAAAVKSLNQGLQRIKFGKDGTGEGIVWWFN